MGVVGIGEGFKAYFTQGCETVTLLHLVDGEERVRPPAPTVGVLAEVARSGRPVRVDDYRPGRPRHAGADGLTGGEDEGGSVLAVPMLVVIKSVADHVDRLKPLGRLMAP